jgi:hypothetical protein
MMQGNRHIVAQPIVFFLGAGSSVPLEMPTTIGFRRVLLNRSSKEGKRLVNALYRSAAYRYRIPEDSINLEEFLEFLHELRLGLWIVSHSRLSNPLSSTLSKIPFDSWAEADLKINSIRWTILELLHEVCGDCSGQRASDLWEPILSELQCFAMVFPIFTLNYDWTFEKLCILRENRFRLTDGFSSALGGDWSSDHFAKFKPSQDRVDICLFKLHGSTCWVGNIKSLGSFDSSGGKPKYGFESGESSPFEIVYPGYRREVWLGDESWTMPGLETDIFVSWRQREPYTVLYQYLDDCLTNARIVVVIGYAFGDTDINARFANTFRENKRVHFVVLDPGRKREKKLPNNLKEVWYEAPYNWALHTDLEPEAWNNRLHWIRGKFGARLSQKSLLEKVKEILEATAKQV